MLASAAHASLGKRPTAPARATCPSEAELSCSVINTACHNVLLHLLQAPLALHMCATPLLAPPRRKKRSLSS